MRSFCSAKASLIFSTKNFSVFGYKVVKHWPSWPLNELVKLTILRTTGPRLPIQGLMKQTGVVSAITRPEEIMWIDIQFPSMKICGKTKQFLYLHGTDLWLVLLDKNYHFLENKDVIKMCQAVRTCFDSSDHAGRIANKGFIENCWLEQVNIIYMLVDRT